MMTLRKLLGSVAAFQKNQQILVVPSITSPIADADTVDVLAKSSGVLVKQLLRGEREYLLDYVVLGLVESPTQPGVLGGIVITAPIQTAPAETAE